MLSSWKWIINGLNPIIPLRKGFKGSGLSRGHLGGREAVNPTSRSFH